MKLAVTSFGSSLDSPVDLHTGRAASLILYDTEEESHDVIYNWHHTQLLHWAGSNTTRTLIEARVDAVIVRQIGPCAFRALSDAGIQVWVVEEETTVVRAIRRFREGKLSLAEGPNCKGHDHLAPSVTNSRFGDDW